MILQNVFDGRCVLKHCSPSLHPVTLCCPLTPFPPFPPSTFPSSQAAALADVVIGHHVRLREKELNLKREAQVFFHVNLLTIQAGIYYIGSQG